MVRRLALLLAVEGLALVVLGVGYGVASRDRASALTAAGFALVMGLVLVGLARAVDTGRGWSRGPAVALNLFPLLVGFSLLTDGVWWVGLPLLLLGATVLYLFATPDLRELFRER